MTANDANLRPEGAVQQIVFVETADGLRAFDALRVVEILPMIAVDRFPGEGGANYVGAVRYRGALAPTFSLVEQTDPVQLVDHLMVITRASDDDAGPLVALVVRAVHAITSLPATARTRLATGGAAAIEGVTWEGAFVRILQPERFLT